MPHPKHRFSQTRTAKRRSHDRVESVQLATCPNCGAVVESHRVCPECGYYRGKLAIEPEQDKSAK
ncbi:MAG: 50S ribosomal protein L32 [Bacteroidales bacterium]|nr:50S ribosomal protein L32 [Bacteroidales bacterium]